MLVSRQCQTLAHDDHLEKPLIPTRPCTGLNLATFFLFFFSICPHIAFFCVCWDRAFSLFSFVCVFCEWLQTTMPWRILRSLMATWKLIILLLFYSAQPYIMDNVLYVDMVSLNTSMDIVHLHLDYYNVNCQRLLCCICFRVAIMPCFDNHPASPHSALVRLRRPLSCIAAVNAMYSWFLKY
jgi:hypothetical protein